MSKLSQDLDILMNNAPNLATDPRAQAAYNEPGSWGRMSADWPSVPYTIGKQLLCTKANVVPYGQYVVAEERIRCATQELCDRLEEAYRGMFIECRRHIAQELQNTDPNRITP